VLGARDGMISEVSLIDCEYFRIFEAYYPLRERNIPCSSRSVEIFRLAEDGVLDDGERSSFTTAVYHTSHCELIEGVN
jgi:hypothetical protein